MNWSPLVTLLSAFWFVPSALGQKSEICVAYESSYHIEKGCECLVFESYGGSRGTFTSPNFPLEYPSTAPCILYTFIGDANETVEIAFEHFHLPPPLFGRCSDFVRLFLDLERPEMSSEMKSNFELCGNLSSVDKSYHSTNRSLIVEFHSGKQPSPPPLPPSSSSSSSSSSLPTSSHTGFKAVYTFNDKLEFETRGVSRWSSGCAYEFRSTAFPDRGASFYSPGFPHPPSTSCRYFFIGAGDERVVLNFTSVHLDSSSSSSSLECGNTFLVGHGESGMITIRDGLHDSSKILRRFCGSLKAPEDGVVKSSEENIFVHFSVGVRKSFRGFAAKFRFERAESRAPASLPSATSIRSDRRPPTETAGTFPALEQLVHNGPPNSDRVWMEGMEGVLHGHSLNHSDCNRSISGATSEQGEIMSPGYPRPYPWNQTCSFLLAAGSHQQIQLVFLDFDMKRNISGSNYDCSDIDSVIVTAIALQPTKDLGSFCGDAKPPALMIHEGDLMVLMKTSREFLPGNFRGFRAKYTFTSDFGINSGDQTMPGECSFSYNSSKVRSGSFHSPNHPGLYPRNLVCHYKFYAGPDERVETVFLHLDVDGIVPFCGPETQSDSIELSNFESPLGDRKMLPLCGSNRDQGQPGREYKYSSDGSFFRVTFRSNDCYDATGFRASYRFIPRHRDTERVRSGMMLRGGSDGSSDDIKLGHLAVLLVLCVNSFARNADTNYF